MPINNTNLRNIMEHKLKHTHTVANKFLDILIKINDTYVQQIHQLEKQTQLTSAAYATKETDIKTCGAQQLDTQIHQYIKAWDMVLNDDESIFWHLEITKMMFNWPNDLNDNVFWNLWETNLSPTAYAKLTHLDWNDLKDSYQHQDKLSYLNHKQYLIAYLLMAKHAETKLREITNVVPPS